MEKPKFVLTRREALQGITGVFAASLAGIAPYAQATETLAAGESDHELLFNSDWRFHHGEVTGAEVVPLDDSSWRKLDVPHDWSIEDLAQDRPTGQGTIWSNGTDPTSVGPFDLYASGGQAATGWTVGGVGWYRKTFQVSAIPADGKAEIRFEGVYMNSDVWLNGIHLGNHPYGYTEFIYDLTPALKPETNLLAVRVNNAGRNSRWYSGSGIFRNVWLRVTDGIRIPQHGVLVTTVDIAKSEATVHVQTEIENSTSAEKRLAVHVRLTDTRGALAAEGRVTASVAARAISTASCDLRLANPRLWSPDDPQLYRAEVIVAAGGKQISSSVVSFGVRTVEIDAAQGLRINGASYKMRGGCVHNDNGALGSACIARAEERKLELLKANGFNAIRTSHNPPSPAFLDACDRLGFMVIDEAFDCWENGKNPDDYHVYFKEWWQRNLESMILRDRNHPSVILWSIGNEIHERAEPEGIALGKALSSYAKKLDPTRLVTAAICGPWDHPKQTWQDIQPAFTYLDVGGYNYEWNEYQPDHATYPDRIMVGTESLPKEAYENWKAVDNSPWVLGDFVWTAVDYIGESGLGNVGISEAAGSVTYPWFNSYCGDIDLIGNKKPQSYFRDVVWGRSKVEMTVLRPLPARRHEHISPWGWSDELRSWSWDGFENAPVTVRVYTSGDRVQLLLNGKQVGDRKLSDSDRLTAEFTVPYSPGELRALAYKNDVQIGEIMLATVDKAAALTLTPDRNSLRASRDDLSYVMVRVVDRAGNLLPDATIPVNFTIDGTGEIAGIANANPKNVSSFRLPQHATFHGACLVILRPTGRTGAVTLTAEAEGLAKSSVSINVG